MTFDQLPNGAIAQSRNGRAVIHKLDAERTWLTSNGAHHVIRLGYSQPSPEIDQHHAPWRVLTVVESADDAWEWGQ